MNHPSSEWIRNTLDQYEKPLLHYAYGIVRRIEPAQDAVQESFITLSQTPQEEVETKVKAWLYTVCRNRCLDFLKKDKRMSPLEPELIDNHPGNHSSPSASLEAEEKSAHLERILEKLPNNQQEVLRLKFLHDMSYRQISSITELSESNVGFLIHTGIKTLRQTLGNQLQELI